MQDYAKIIKTKLSISSVKGGSDYFMSIMREISELFNIYEYKDFSNVIEKINASPQLKSWIVMIISMIIFGKNDGNNIQPASIPFADNPYLKIWKNKFSVGDNDFSGLPKDSLCVYEFVPNDTSSLAGCFSNQYFVIPPKEVKRNNNISWRKFYYTLLDSKDDLENAINSNTNELQKIILKLSAESIPDNKPVSIIKTLIDKCVSMPAVFEIGQKLPCVRINDVSFFSTDIDFIPKKPFTDDICLVNSENKYFSLYPFSERLIDDIENGSCSISKIRMKICRDIDRKINSVSVFSDIDYFITFTDNMNNKVTVPCRTAHSYNYSKDNIKEAENLHTFCMYPDIPLEYEHRCKKYTYFSSVSSFVKGKGELPKIHLSENTFRDIAGNSETINLNSTMKFDFASASKPNHIIKIKDTNNIYIGSVLNLRTLNRNYPALLTVDAVTDISLQTESVAPDSHTKMYAYIDFGNSTSSIGYKINNGAVINDDITGGTSLIRPLLALYDKENYDIFIDFSVRKSSRIPSVVVSYDSAEKSLDSIMNYHQAWIIMTEDIRKFEDKKIPLSINFKSEIPLNRNTDSSHIMIFNLCYIAVCKAISENLDNIFIFPSFPDERYYNILYSIWNLVIKKINEYFSINITNMLECNNRHMLYESVVSIEKIEQTGNNILITNVHIGDEKTDMSAVFVDNFGKKKLCAYSSLNYGGKNLLNAVLYDALSNALTKTDAMTFFLGDNGKNAFISSINSVNTNDIAKSICQKFFLNSKRKGRPRNKNWQVYFLHLLETETINSFADDDAMDIKARADLLLRYAVLMPVIWDFISTAMTLCESSEKPPVNINFCGGASKGIVIADKISGNSFIKNIEKYFGEYFDVRSITVSDMDSKKQIINGMAKYYEYIDSNGNYSISSPLDSNYIESELKPICTDDFYGFSDFENYLADIIEKFITDAELLNFLENSSFVSSSSNEINQLVENSELCGAMLDNTVHMFEVCYFIRTHFGKGFFGKAVLDGSDKTYGFNK